MELSRSNIEKISQEKAFLLFQETKTPKKLIFFSKETFSYISGNGNPEKKSLYFRKLNFLYFKHRNYFS